MVDYTKGQTVSVARAHRANRASGWGGRDFRAGDQVEITAVRKATITARHRQNAQSNWLSYNFDRGELRRPNNEEWDAEAAAAAKAARDAAKPKTRKLGVPPEDGEHIAADDPRIAWLWEDAGKLATRMGYCSTYDDISDKLGIPGREREFYITTKINGIDVSASIKARSQTEAETTLREKLGTTSG